MFAKGVSLKTVHLAVQRVFPKLTGGINEFINCGWKRNHFKGEKHAVISHIYRSMIEYYTISVGCMM